MRRVSFIFASAVVLSLAPYHQDMTFFAVEPSVVMAVDKYVEA